MKTYSEIDIISHENDILEVGEIVVNTNNQLFKIWRWKNKN